MIYGYKKKNNIKKIKESCKPINTHVIPSYSISNVLSDQKNDKYKEEILYLNNNINNNFTLLQIKNFYLKFINRLFITNKIHAPIFHSIKNINFVKIHVNFSIDIEFISNSVLCNFQKINTYFLQKLRLFIQNNSIKFNFIINNNYKSILTREDILKQMIMKNRLVLRLQKELHLEF